jgi:glucose-6-phosphate isomerase
MEHINVDISKTFEFVSKSIIDGLQNLVKEKNLFLENKTGKGNDFLGWVKLPSTIDDKDLAEIKTIARSMVSKIDVVVVIGIGGSYLGTRAVYEALSHSFIQLNKQRDFPLIIYAGHNIGEDYLSELIETLNEVRYGIVVISKSGTTTEPAIAFRILKNHLEKKVGKEAAKELIIAVTDAAKGALRTMAVAEGYKTFVIPDDIGGRYSVLTPVGLVPLAIGGIDIKSLVEGARAMEKITGSEIPFEKNPAELYAATRYTLYRLGKKIEILANYDNKLHYLAEWWKQLFGESEGKQGKGLFPASVDLTADLHSMGQYIQEGERILIETVLSIKEPINKLTVPHDPQNLDGLNFISGKRIDEINKMAELGTLLAHVDGGVPNIRITIPKLNEYFIGQLLYMFERACGISGYLLDVNPFDQPGVEAYKKNMFALLEKPGYEEETQKIKARL